MVIEPASTGMAAISRNAVISQVHANIGIFISVMPGARMLRIVAMMLIEPRMDDMPSRWIDSSVKSVPMPPCTDSGGYSVQPPAGPPPGMNRPRISSVAANGRIQNDQLFRRGSAMSGAPIIIGTIQLASPTNAGMAKPKIMTSACTVVI